MRGHRPAGHQRLPRPRIIIAKEGGDIVNASQGGRDDVFGNKGDDTPDVQDGVDNDFVNYDESAKTDPSATAATSSPTATATSPGAVWLRACLPSGQILDRLDGSWCRASGSETAIP
jgi:hypothetical protein